MEQFTNKGDRSQSAMSRPCKIFISIDNEGLLFDAISISDVANFDCYESVMKSAQRIIGMFNLLKPDEVLVERMFYYKRRARSNRMNPVPLLTTTDVFRAVAEHPTGEVPIGVHWCKKTTYKTKAKTQKVETEEEADPAVLVKIEEVNPDDGQPVPPVSKKRKLEPRTNEPIYKTYMPTSTEPAPAAPVISTPAAPVISIVGVDTVPKATTHPEMTSLIQNNSAPVVSSTPTTQTYTPPQMYMDTGSKTPTPFGHHTKPKTMYPDVDVLNKFTPCHGGRPQHTSDSNYQWPGYTSCEIVFHYEGISERKRVSSKLKPVLQHMVNKNYNDLRPEVSKRLLIDSIPTAQDKLDSLNNSNMSDEVEKNIIRHLKEAKFEIFKVLSLLCMSKARFDDLLRWMRSLKLEEGQQGKFFLSERNRIGSNGLRVQFDTDLQAATRFENIQSVKTKNPVPKMLYPHTPAQPQYTSDQLRMMMSTSGPPQSSGASLLTSTAVSMAQTQVLLNTNASENEPPKKVMLSDGTLLVPVPGKQIKASELLKQQQNSASEPIKGSSDVQKLVKYNPPRDTIRSNLEPAKRLPLLAHSLLKNKTTLSNTTDPVPLRMFRTYNMNESPDVTSDVSDTTTEKHSYSFRKRKPRVTFKEADSDTESTESNETYKSNETEEAESSELGELPICIIKQEPVDDNEGYDQENGYSQLQINPSSIVHGEEADKAHEFDYVIKTEPFDDYSVMDDT